MYLAGVFNDSTMIEWAIHTWVEPALIEHHIDWSIRPVSELAAASLGGLRSRSMDSWVSHGPADPFWTREVFGGASVRHGSVPTLHMGGFYDVFSRGQLRDYAHALGGSRAGDQFLVMDATDHFDDLLTPSGVIEDYGLDPATAARFIDERYLPTPLDFFDRYLLDRN